MTLITTRIKITYFKTPLYAKVGELIYRSVPHLTDPTYHPYTDQKFLYKVNKKVSLIWYNIRVVIIYFQDQGNIGIVVNHTNQKD